MLENILVKQQQHQIRKSEHNEENDSHEFFEEVY